MVNFCNKKIVIHYFFFQQIYNILFSEEFRCKKPLHSNQRNNPFSLIVSIITGNRDLLKLDIKGNELLVFGLILDQIPYRTCIGQCCEYK